MITNLVLICIVPDSRTRQDSLTKMGSINVEEFPSMRVGSLITLDILNMVRQSFSCVLEMVVQSMFISPTRTTLGHESKAISIEACIDEM